MNIRAKIFGGASKDEATPVVAAKQPTGAKHSLGTINVAREEARRGDTRGGDRHRLPDEQVHVTLKGKRKPVQLVNLSGGGAMVSGSFRPKLWDRLELHLGDEGSVECVVRWLKDDRVGLEFAHETRLDCSVGEQAALLRQVIANSFPDVEFEAAAREAEVAPAADEHRGERRHPLIWSGVVHHDYQSNPVRLRNISSTGALVECETRLRVGAEPLLDLGEAGQIFTTVTWAIGDQAGLKFHQHFDLALLARAKPEIAPARWTCPTYLQPGPVTTSPWDKEWNRMSISELREDLEGFLKR